MSLLDLPPEIRDMIYGFCASDSSLTVPRSEAHDGPAHKLTLHMGQICKQLRQEYLPIHRRKRTRISLSHLPDFLDDHNYENEPGEPITHEIELQMLPRGSFYAMRGELTALLRVTHSRPHQKIRFVNFDDDLEHILAKAVEASRHPLWCTPLDYNMRPVRIALLKSKHIIVWISKPPTADLQDTLGRLFVLQNLGLTDHGKWNVHVCSILPS